jgi:hypothetical protein
LAKVRLIRKLAECIDGIDLTDRRVGETIDVPATAARLLLAEQWAELVEPQPFETLDPLADPAVRTATDDLPLTILIPLRDQEPT